MTCREKLKIERPEEIDDAYKGGCFSCPIDYDYLPHPEYCSSDDSEACKRCWDREIPEADTPCILDSGERREFRTGAVRDIAEGKGRCDLLPLDTVAYVLGSPMVGTDDVLIAVNTYVRSGFEPSIHLAIEKFCKKRGWDKYTAMLEVSKHYEEGAKKYDERNWEKGISLHCYIDSGVRHYLKFLRGDTDEPHDRAFVWNMLGALWTQENKPELIDLPFVQNNNEIEE